MDKELRKGNLVYRPYDKTTHIVSGIMDDYVWLGKNGRATYYSKIAKLEPIQLTEKWLEDFGIEWEEDLLQFLKVLSYDFGEFILHPTPHGGYVFSEGSIESHLKYVHQLQNLYFALTGDELTVKIMNK